MKFLATLAALAATACAWEIPSVKALVPRASDSSGVPIVTVKGNAFYQGKKRFYIRGVAYQPGGASGAQDPLLDLEALERDIKLFKQLGINTIRVYIIDNSKNHDKAMKMLEDAEIYLALDANSPKFSLNREDVDTSYNSDYLQSVFATIDAFKDYNNLLLLFSGNEVINAPNSTSTAPYIKAVTRDMKNYIANRGYRPIPVGYSSADVSENIEEQLKYFSCGSGKQARVDFFAFNDYSWCDPSSFTKSGWNVKVKTYGGYDTPIFLSEFGCNTNTRKWEELSALYTDKMSHVYSGGLAYEFTLEKNGYGLVSQSGGSVKPNADFKRLAAAYEKYPSPGGDGGATTDGKIPDCPARSKQWNVKDKLIPAPPSGISKYMSGGAGKGPGLAKSAGTSQGGGESQSEEMIEMNGAEASGTPATVSEDGKSSSGGKAAEGEGVALPVRLAMVFVAMIAGGVGATILV